MTGARALELALIYHAKQKDKAGQPYYLHPVRVMKKCNNQKEKIVSLLHDILEDTVCTKEILKGYDFSPEIIEAVVAITKVKGEAEDDYYKRVVKNNIAIKVKQFDLEDNMDITRLPVLTNKDIERLKKYHKYWLQIKTLLNTATRVV